MIQQLKYLLSQQALEDLSHFVWAMQTQQQQQWITFGGSYLGYISGNAHLKYPHLIYAAVANLVPLELKVKFLKYKAWQGWALWYNKVGGSNVYFEIVQQGHKQAVELLDSAHFMDTW